MPRHPPPQEYGHIDNARLFRVAVADNLLFTGAEFDHLKACPTCFEQWKQFIHDYVRDEAKQDARLKRGGE